MQALGSAVMSEFDAFKKCELAKKAGKKEGGEGGDSRWLLGEGENSGLQQAMPKQVADGVGVGEYIYYLKNLEDVSGTVSVAHAMDALMKCHKDGTGKHGHSDEDDMGESYAPDETQSYAEGAKESGGPSGVDLAQYCMPTSIQQTIDNIVGPSDGAVKYKCATMGIQSESYTADCNGGGKIESFLQSTEAYHRNVASTFFTWKTKCASLHNANEEFSTLTLLEETE